MPVMSTKSETHRGPRRILRCIAITALSLIGLIGLIVLIFWLVVRPKPLEYSIDKARISNFNITDDELNATFDLTLRSYNDNHRVSVYYDYVEVTVWYGDQMLAFSELQPFYQPRRNVTTLDVSAKARSMPLLSPVEKNLKQDRSGGEVTLDVRVQASIRFKVGLAKTKHYSLKVYCSPVVNFSMSKQFNKAYCDVDI